MSKNYQWQFSEWTWVQLHNKAKITFFCSIVENSEGVNGLNDANNPFDGRMLWSSILWRQRTCY